MKCLSQSGWTKLITILTIIVCIIYASVLIAIDVLVYFYIDFVKTFVNNINELTDLKYLILRSCSFGLSVCWIISSICLLISLSKRRQTKTLLINYILWDVIAILALITDIISTVFYSLDAETNKDIVLYLLLISSRCGFIIFHIISWIGMIVITNSVRKNVRRPRKRTIPLKPPKSALKPSKVPHLEENNLNRVQDWHKHYENGNYLQSDSFPKYLDNSSSSPAVLPQPHSLIPGSNTNVFVNGVPSGTLRRQLPWSYTSNNSAEVPLKQPRRSSLLSAPNIPVPDYSVQNPKTLNRRNFNEPGWTQYL